MCKCGFSCLTVLAAIFCALSACATPPAEQAASAVQPDQTQASALEKETVKPAVRVIEADMWLQVSDNASCVLEGPAFDRDGNLYFVDVSGRGRVYKADTAARTLKLVYEDGRSNYAAAEIHKDGRIFLCGYIDNNMIIVKPDGVALKEIKPVYNGEKLIPDDLVFDNAGNFYFTSYDKASATGGVYRMPADLSRVDLIVGNLDHPNGVSVSPDGRYIWVPETLKRVVHKYELESDGTVNISDPQKSEKFDIPINLPGYPDSNEIDSAGNLYQALWGGAGLAVFDSQGNHIATVKLPEADVKNYHQTTNLAFSPGSDLGYLTTSGPGGGRIYTFTGLARGKVLYSHQ